MNTLTFFKGLINSKESPIVICDIDYKIIFMNTSALKEYEKYGGKDMIGKHLTLFCSTETMSKVDMVIEWFKEDKANNRIFATHKKETNEDIYIIAIRDENESLIGFTSVYECRTPEKAEQYEMD